MLFTLPAIILDKGQFKEIDLLVTLFTPRGKIKVLAKGAQKSRRRFLNLLEDLNYVRVHLRKPKKGNFLILERLDLIYFPESPWENLGKFYFFSYIAETLLYTNPPFLKRGDFNFVVDFLKAIDKKTLSFEDKFFWEFKWLQICGFSPNLESCVECGVIPKKVFYFSIPRGGLLCYDCKDLSCEGLTLKQIEILRKIGKINKLEEFIQAMYLFSWEEKEKILYLMENFFLFHLNWEPKSLSIIKEYLYAL